MPRLDYDRIAHLYDGQPFRQKAVDDELLRFAGKRPTLRYLEIACGTGNQILANQVALPKVQYVGVDRFAGMLKQAKRKGPRLPWLQADAAALPFVDGAFDFITCQYAFHHFEKKGAFIKEVARVLKPSGRFVLQNVSPREMKRSALYRFFPDAFALDQRDFWPNPRIERHLRAAGFSAVSMEVTLRRFEREAAEFAEYVGRRDNNSELMAMSDLAYARGLKAARAEKGSVPDEFALLKFVAEKAAEPPHPETVS